MVGEESERNEDNCEVGIAAAVTPLTESATSAHTLAQPTSKNTIYEGVGGLNFWEVD